MKRPRRQKNGKTFPDLRRDWFRALRDGVHSLSASCLLADLRCAKMDQGS
ncbi:hypothetical protein P4H83_30995 [Paenibacillus favisporus]|nr:hypothetical protein [Paenibacillus favisporus]MEC0179318.1 hypothetical protein [Paenibacillus favisporus]